MFLDQPKRENKQRKGKIKNIKIYLTNIFRQLFYRENEQTFVYNTAIRRLIINHINVHHVVYIKHRILFELNENLSILALVEKRQQRSNLSQPSCFFVFYVSRSWLMWISWFIIYVRTKKNCSCWSYVSLTVLWFYCAFEAAEGQTRKISVISNIHVLTWQHKKISKSSPFVRISWLRAYDDLRQHIWNEEQLSI